MMAQAGQDQLIGIVLAGGRSSRMGRDKAGLTWRSGQTFLDRAMAQLREVGCGSVIVSGKRPGHDCVPDRWPGQGPLGGMASVLEARPALSGRLVIVPVDMPRLRSDSLRSLVAAARGDGARYADVPLPMVLCLSDRLRSVVAVMMQSEARSLRALARGLDMAVVEPTPADARANINTPADLQRQAEDEMEDRDEPRPL
ncbi:MAG: molybdenum cofactor guanylyltransferase [Pseudomonadota bacterium]|nr:MAG: molybdenum cofactor guanylyltransferase [Pseudomonadota bacterium]